ncbi:unnamed protein product [Rotaria sordida]|uniref:Uncharacterized protein n=2 Tax=Rotaria sordida TaxID=392033 RepID=A0A819W5R3_9BILA|nr:unnamed protein product [Rotaria sordida]
MNTRLLNSDLIINDKGNIVGRYSKIDLFYVQPAYLVIRESDFTQLASSITNPIETSAGRIPLGIVFYLINILFKDISFYHFVKLYIFVYSDLQHCSSQHHNEIFLQHALIH